jgi:hypothetical protein
VTVWPGDPANFQDGHEVQTQTQMQMQQQAMSPQRMVGSGQNQHEDLCSARYISCTSPIQHHSTHSYIMTFPREVRNLFAGGVAGMMAKSLVAPVDRIKILYQVSSRSFRLQDVPQIASKIIQEEGIQALWKGNTATMIRVFPYSGIQFMVFDRCKTFFLQRHRDAPQTDRPWGLSPLESLLSGSVAGICSAACTYPLDMTRAQLAVLKSKKHAHNIGFVGILVKNYKERVRAAFFCAFAVFVKLFRHVIADTIVFGRFVGAMLLVRWHII